SIHYRDENLIGYSPIGLLGPYLTLVELCSLFP
ncbi:hypothetical protein HKBW3C_02617, partial [Candidatus Hakubella thermalkaliphila]